MVVLPVGSDIYIKRYVDQCIYLEQRIISFKMLLCNRSSITKEETDPVKQIILEKKRNPHF